MSVEKYIEIVTIAQKPRTYVWAVNNMRTHEKVGEIKWYGGWRKYVFYPEPNTLFDWECMALIGGFCKSQTQMRREDQYYSQL